VNLRGWVLYEDSRTAAGDFKLHELVLRRAQDVLSPQPGYRELLARFGARACKGRDNVLRMCLRDGPKLRRGGAAVFAVLDGDRIHDLTKLPKHGCVGPHVAAVRAKLPDELDARVVIVRQNIETLIEALRAGPSIPEIADQTFENALKKDRTARDGVFMAASRERCRDVRENLAEKVPDFGYLAGKIASVMR
jgi:hypothetical protein